MSLFGELFEQDENIANKIWGVTTGIVLENWNDEQKGKVKVEMNLGTQGKNVSGWIPVMTPYGGNGYGLYALPEVGALVVIAFEMGDRNRPMVIGSLWNQKNALPENCAVEKNNVKRLRSMGGCEIFFEEEQGKEKVTIHTPGSLTILLDDEKKTITMEDEGKANSLVINADSGEVTLLADKKLVCKVGGKAMLTLDGSSKKCEINCDEVDIKAGQNLKLKGQNANLEGGMVTVKADSSLGLESSGMAKLKGSIVKIN